MFSNIFPKSVFHALISNIRPCSSRLPVPLQPRLLAGLPTTSSATSLSARASRDPLAALRFSPRTIHYFPSRQFVSSVRRPVRYGGYSYRRFDQGQGPQGAPGTPLVKVLLATAGGVGVLYIYNLETVEVGSKLDRQCQSLSCESNTDDLLGHWASPLQLCLPFLGTASRAGTISCNPKRCSWPNTSRKPPDCEECEPGPAAADPRSAHRGRQLEGPCYPR